jgi:hypothetical protein
MKSGVLFISSFPFPPMEIVQSTPQRNPDGYQEELYWWFSTNGDDRVCVEDRKERIIVMDARRNGETSDEALHRILAEIGRLSLALRKNFPPIPKGSGTMPE